MHQTTCIWRDLSVGWTCFLKCIPALLRYCDRYYLGILGAQLTQTSSFNWEISAISRAFRSLQREATSLKQAAGVAGADNQVESQLIHPWINHTSWGFGKAVASANKQTW